MPAAMLGHASIPRQLETTATGSTPGAVRRMAG